MAAGSCRGVVHVKHVQCIWDVASDAELTTMSGHSRVVSAVPVSSKHCTARSCHLTGVCLVIIYNAESD